MDADSNGVDAMLATPFETVGENFVAPDVLAGEPLDGVKIVELVMLDNLSPIPQAQDVRRGKVRSDFVIADLGRGNHRFTLLMKERGIKKKLRMFHFEAATAFLNAAFAENENLFSTPERINDDGPFLECSNHCENVGYRA